jgi:hypothetical protein
MDCRDRFAVWLVELVLEPVRALRENGGGSAVVRTALGERRFDVTVSRAGGEYRWALREVGGPLVGESSAGLSDPEDAFWDAWTSIEAAA